MLILIVVIIYGLIIGSFLGALVWRTHDGKSIAKGRSACQHCGHQLSVLDLVPVISWLALRGRCRYCGKPIGWQDLWIELLTATLFGLSYAVLMPQGTAGWAQFVAWLVVLSAGIVLVVYDLRWLLLPDVIVLPAIGFTALALILGWLTHAITVSQLVNHGLAALIAGGAFYLLAAVAGGKLMGGGDVKLAFLMGLVLGESNTIAAMAVGFYSAAIVGIVLIIARRKKRKDYIPFGPFLVAGMVAAYLYGPWLIQAYENLINRIII